MTPKKSVEAIKKAHPAIEKYVYNALANKLMLLESDNMTSAILKLLQLTIPALSIQDSVIVHNRQKDVAERVMRDTYKEHTGFNIVIK